MRNQNKAQLENDIESVALGTLLTGMRKLYWDTEQFMRSRIEEVERRYRQLVGTAKTAARHELDDEQPLVARRGRPRKVKLAINQAKGGWSNDPEERSREMKRRQKVRGLKRAAKAAAEPRHPRDPKHPKHAEWLANVSRAAIERWENMSASKRKQRLAAMRAGRAQQKVNGQLEA